MNLVQLKTFLSVARLNSFRQAADQLGTTQPAVSARISGLEDSLGVTLFLRASGAVSLTAKGNELIPLAERLLALSEHIKLRIGGTNAASGILRLGVAETIVHTWLADFIRVLHREYPNIDLEVNVDVSVNMRDAIVSHNLDLAFLMGPVSEYTVTNLPLCSFPFVWVASPTLGLGGKSMSLAEAAQFPLLTFSRATRPNAELSEQVRLINGGDPRIFGSSSLAACRQMAVDGVGVAVLPVSCLKDDLEAGRLETVAVDWTPPDLCFTASFAAQPENPLAAVVAQVAQRVSDEYEARNQ